MGRLDTGGVAGRPHRGINSGPAQQDHQWLGLDIPETEIDHAGNAVLPGSVYSDPLQLAGLFQQKPLALYLFSEDKAHIEQITHRICYGGGCINDTIIHLATSEMPFGGVGESGMGGYHGREGFNAFSHTKSIVDKKTWMDLPMRYQPYKDFNFKLLKMFLK